ncbi:hypothetical protein [Saccharopolyspora sp. NPDC050642]|uniref:hypothetical protein n=1 Tax=Saccharopolyspora sp. NPDC050642 TaxID=3157099 RepID=UPI0034049E8B
MVILTGADGIAKAQSPEAALSEGTGGDEEDGNPFAVTIYRVFTSSGGDSR